MRAGREMFWRLFVLAIAPACSSGPDATPSANMPALHAVWSFPAAPTNANGKLGFWNIDSRLLVTKDPGPKLAMFWAATFDIDGSGGGGYIGLQDGAARRDGSLGRIAIFSVWKATGANAASGASCTTFSNEGSGVACHLDYDWTPGHTYRLRVWAIPPAAWRGAILDEQTGVETALADILVPAEWGWLEPTLDDFTENFAENSGTRYASCAEAPKTSATWFAPTANDSSAHVDGGVGNVNTNANCTNVRSTVAQDLTDAIQEMNPD